MASGMKSPRMVMSTLLLVVSLLVCTFHTAAAATSTETSPSPSPDASSPPPDTFSSPDPPVIDEAMFLKYKQADPEDIGTYNIIFNTHTTFSTCRLKGFYDDKELKTKELIENCFNEISNTMETNYNVGYIYDSDTYYYLTTDYPYCAIKCFTITDSAASPVTSVQLSFVSVAFASMAFLALNHF